MKALVVALLILFGSKAETDVNTVQKCSSSYNLRQRFFWVVVACLYFFKQQI